MTTPASKCQEGEEGAVSLGAGPARRGPHPCVGLPLVNRLAHSRHCWVTPGAPCSHRCLGRRLEWPSPSKGDKTGWGSAGGRRLLGDGGGHLDNCGSSTDVSGGNTSNGQLSSGHRLRPELGPTPRGRAGSRSTPRARSPSQDPRPTPRVRGGGSSTNSAHPLLGPSPDPQGEGDGRSTPRAHPLPGPSPDPQGVRPRSPWSPHSVPLLCRWGKCRLDSAYCSHTRASAGPPSQASAPASAHLFLKRRPYLKAD